MSYEALFNQLQCSTTITAAEQFAKYTVPTIFPRDHNTSGDRVAITHDFQSAGALLTNNLTTKMTSALFPIGQSFFTFSETAENNALLEQMGIPEDMRRSYYGRIEEQASARMLSNAGYAKLQETVLLTAVTGNALLIRDRNRFVVYSLRNYAVRRDGTGKVMVIVLRERVDKSEMPSWVSGDHKNDVFVYTKVERKRGKLGDGYVVTREVNGAALGEPAYYPEKLCPYIPVVWKLVTGEHYGRGIIEDYSAAFARLSELTYALTLYEVEALRILNLVNPSGGTDVDSLANKENGEYVQGTKDSITAYEAGCYQKMQQVKADINDIVMELSRAFMYTAQARDSERTTATEINNQIREADQALGGVHATLSEVLHIPMAHILSAECDDNIGTLIAMDVVGVDVSVGIAALNRQMQNTRLLMACNDIQLILPVLAQATQRTNTDALVLKILHAYGVDFDEFILTEQQLKSKLEAEQAAGQAQAQQAAMAGASPELIGQQQGLM